MPEPAAFHRREESAPCDAVNDGYDLFRKDLVALYRGQLQAGIWTPREFAVVFIFSGDSGKAYGYSDGWTESGIFRYTGEGQHGDMIFRAGNKAIRDHRVDGKDLWPFEDLGKGNGVRYVGMFECASWEKVDAPDKEKNIRKAIVFDLVPVATAAPFKEDAFQGPPRTALPSLVDLRGLAYAAAAGNKVSERTGDTKLSWYERSGAVKSYVLARAAGVCEACQQPAPFNKRDGSPYLEPHHTKRLADEGPDHPAWVGSICPNCHRRIHSGEDGEEWNKQLQKRLKALEGLLDKN